MSFPENESAMVRLIFPVWLMSEKSLQFGLPLYGEDVGSLLEDYS
jgi:hypothetical protein